MTLRSSIFSVQDHYPGRGRSIPELYEQVLAQAKFAEDEGYDTFFVAEHHFHEYGVVPNPLIMLSSMAQRTSRIRLGTAISILTFHDPLTVAEGYAMLDVLSGGRLVLGVGSGYLKHEFEGYGVHPSEKRERFDENLAIVERMLSGERVRFDGKWRSVQDVALNVLPLQRPTPPIYVAILAAEAAYHIGKKGQRIFTVPYASVGTFSDIRNLVEAYRNGQADAGIDGGPDDILVTLHAHVAETDGAARKIAAEPFDLYVDTRLYARKQTYDDIMASELSLMGGVATVGEKLAELIEMGVHHVVTLHNFGLIPSVEVENSMRRLMREAVPAAVDRSILA
ncbi:LLM class flavin-dependent oxidoreductase [Amorphus sp. 3PC139-8]|uniref:LLM class flavin-dependent oxidoreductase n=1 Tax=Amorphus sp. 3PC139-8 TaxID=2735676 RepID=UPI00345CBFA5